MRWELRAPDFGSYAPCSQSDLRQPFTSHYRESCPKYLTKGFECFIITLLYDSLKSHDHKTISDSADLEKMSLELRWIFLLIFFPCRMSVASCFLRWHFLDTTSTQYSISLLWPEMPSSCLTLILTYYQSLTMETSWCRISGTRDH